MRRAKQHASGFRIASSIGATPGSPLGAGQGRSPGQPATAIGTIPPCPTCSPTARCMATFTPSGSGQSPRDPAASGSTATFAPANPTTRCALSLCRRSAAQWSARTGPSTETSGSLTLRSARRPAQSNPGHVLRFDRLPTSADPSPRANLPSACGVCRSTCLLPRAVYLALRVNLSAVGVLGEQVGVSVVQDRGAVPELLRDVERLPSVGQ